MKFGQFLIEKRNLIILIMAINSFALGVNILGVNYTWGSCWQKTNNYGGGYHGAQNSLFSFYNYTNANNQYGLYNKQSENFWPFVDFFEKNRYRDCKDFLGIFNNYDSSEFFVYTILLFLVLYIYWETNVKKRQEA